MPRSNKNITLPNNYVSTEPFVRPPRKISQEAPRKYPDRNTAFHAQTILGRLNAIKGQVSSLKQNNQYQSDGIYLTITGEPKDQINNRDFQLKLESLEISKNFNIVSYKKNDDGSEQATLTFPLKNLNSLENKIEKASDTTAPKNIDFVDSISSMRLSELKDLWTSDIELYPTDNNQSYCWELWIFDSDLAEANLLSFCQMMGINVLVGKITLLDRRIFQVTTTPSRLSQILNFNRILCEIKKAADTPYPIIESDLTEQHQWADDINNRIRVNAPNSEVWVIDSGLNHQSNPLLSNKINQQNVLTADSSWGTADERRWYFHGTAMVGLAQFGDLLPVLLTGEGITLNHQIGSFKILPPIGRNEPQNYPFLTELAINEARIASREIRNKIFCMAITDESTSKKGIPTSWSSKIDSLAFGNDEQEKVLFILSSGNVRYENYPRNYPSENELSSIQDPSQSWNALTVGAYTCLDTIDEPHLSSFNCLATPGSLSPSSTTSLTWTHLSKVPFKPDVVLEGGNCAVDSQNIEYEEPASLSVLTTNGRTNMVFDYLNGTSSATGLASNFAARIFSLYPNYWPETVRALIVHSAEWTEQMINEFSPFSPKREKTQALLAKYGFGVPNIERAISCADNEVTLIHQGSFLPFQDGSSKPKYNECVFFDLPWPVEVLQSLGDSNLKMKVTLSYFIEPNPSTRGRVSKYQYASFGLRFTTLGPNETEDSLRHRVSAALRDDEDITLSNDDNSNWKLGPMLRTRGSIHSDIWEGKAADLAGKNKVAIYPVTGWWKEYTQKKCWNNDARFSLIVSIEGPETNTEIYNSVQNKIHVDTSVSIDIET